MGLQENDHRREKKGISMGSFQQLRQRLKALGHETHPPLLFIKLDEPKNGNVTLNQSDLADLDHLIASLVADLERRRS